jgi:ethanolamine utilization microcompartment shell protein EutL
MKKNIARILAVGVILTLFSMPVTVAASADDDDQPHMQAALDALKQAEQHLNMAKHDKGGHRAAALKSTREAIKHVEMGMKAGDKNEDKKGDHDHDKK